MIWVVNQFLFTRAHIQRFLYITSHITHAYMTFFPFHIYTCVWCGWNRSGYGHFCQNWSMLYFFSNFYILPFVVVFFFCVSCFPFHFNTFHHMNTVHPTFQNGWGKFKKKNSFYNIASQQQPPRQQAAYILSHCIRIQANA